MNSQVHGKTLVYLDNAATMQMPEAVLRSVADHYHTSNANVHRGVHALSQRATNRLEETRRTVARFIGAETREIIFTAGTTDALNQLSRMLETEISPGTQILVSAMEHHSNLLPWQRLCGKIGAKLRVIPLDENGELDLEMLRRMLEEKTALVAVAWVSNVLGTVNPISKIAAMAHDAGALLVVDGAQGMRVGRTDVTALDCDFMAFSGHKLGGLTGTGVLYGRYRLLERLSPVVWGGGMIEAAGYTWSNPCAIPQRFEGGTPNYVGAISLGAAIDYLQEIGVERIAQRECELVSRLESELLEIDGLHILARPKQRAGAISFYMDGIHSFDIGVMLDALGIAIRTGHMCAQPLVESYGVTNVLRVSPAFYNTDAEISDFLCGLRRIIPRLRREKL